MFKKPTRINQLLHLLSKPPLQPDQLSETRERLWQSIAMATTMESIIEPTKPKLWGLQPLYLYSGVSLATLTLVAGLTYYQFHKPTDNHPNQVAIITSPTPLPTDTATPAFVTLTPTELPTSTPLAIPTSTPTSTPQNTLSQIQLSSAIPVYNTSLTSTTTTGVRNPAEKVSFLDFFLGKARATSNSFGTRAYPAVYYVDSTGKTIKEVNVYTGETKTVISEDRSIGSLGFSTSEQTLVYTYVSGDDKYYPPVSVKLFNLNTNAGRIIGTTHMHGGLLSPDGTEYAYFQSTQERASNPDSLIIYHFSTDATQIISAQSVFGTTGFVGASKFTWADNATLTTDTTASDGSQGVQMIAKRIDINTPGGISTITDKTPHNFYSEHLVNNRLFTNTYNAADSSDYAYVSGKPPVKHKPSNANYGWLSYVDLNSNALVDLRQQTGDFLKEYLVNSIASTIVFSQSVLTNSTSDAYTMKLSAIDLNTLSVVSLPVPDSSFTIVGWNGNESNLLIQTGNGYTGNLRFYNVDIVGKVLTPVTQ